MYSQVMEKKMKTKSYSELMELKTFEERFEYLKIKGYVGEITHGGHRYLNQQLYSSNRWQRLRKQIIMRDDGCDLAIPDRQIHGKIVIHHINPISLDDLVRQAAIIFDPENLITVAYATHEAIHYSSIDMLPKDYIPRRENDTCPWR